VSGCLTLIVLAIFGLGAVFFGLSEALTGSEPYKYAVDEATNSPELIAVLGEPIETNGIMQGTVNFKDDSGSVDIRIPLIGPNGEATLIVVGEKEDGIWSYEELFVSIKETNEKINLLGKILEGN
jgi:hypothetical protein